MTATHPGEAGKPYRLAVAYLLTFHPQYLIQSLQEIEPLVDRCVLVLMDHNLDGEQIARQAREVLGDRPVLVQKNRIRYSEALVSAVECVEADWLLLLEADECVDGPTLTQILEQPDFLSGIRYTAPTHFFWHDGSHRADGPHWKRANEKVRLMRLTPEPHRSQGAEAPKLCEGLDIYNYSHVVPYPMMQERLVASGEQARSTGPTDWLSPWWELGINHAPEQIKRYEGKHPSSMAHLCTTRIIHDFPAPVPESLQRPLVWESWIGQEISFGVIIDQTLRYLEASGWEPHLHAVNLLGPAPFVPPQTRRALQRESERRESLKHHPNTIVVKLSYAEDWTHLRYTRARIKIGYTPYEQIAMSPIDVNRANLMDRIMVTSSYVQRVGEASGIRRPYFVYHHGYDPQYLRPVIRPERSEFTFLAVMVLNWRKGPDILLDTFVREFEGEADVKLVVKTSPHIWHQTLHQELLARYGSHPQITFIEHHHTEAQMAQLYEEADCFVLPTRGEGFGLPLLEAMATGLPVIATNWSGHLDFCTQSNSFLIEIKNRDQLEFALGVEPWWADPDREHLAALMRYVVAHRQEAQLRGVQAAQDVADWTWENQVQKLHHYLQSL